jgi:hypothetical protein
MKKATVIILSMAAVLTIGCSRDADRAHEGAEALKRQSYARDLQKKFDDMDRVNPPELRFAMTVETSSNNAKTITFTTPYSSFVEKMKASADIATLKRFGFTRVVYTDNGKTIYTLPLE